MSCLYILEINPLSVDSFANIFSHSEGCLFVLFVISFAWSLELLKQYHRVIKRANFEARLLGFESRLNHLEGVELRQMTSPLFVPQFPHL